MGVGGGEGVGGPKGLLCRKRDEGGVLSKGDRLGTGLRAMRSLCMFWQSSVCFSI